MDVLRGVGAVILGYILCQGVNGFFVYFWYVSDGSAPPDMLPVITTLLFLVVGLGTGWICARLAGRFGMRAAWTLAALVGLVTIGNIIADVAAEPLWHKLIVLSVMVPGIVVAAHKALPAAAH